MSAASDGFERLGDYELLQPLGRGGMAEVWLARRRGPGNFERKVVVKRILAQHTYDDAFTKMFLAEARLCARLSHPNIVAVHELGDSGGQYYIVMEYVNGRDLRKILQMLSSGDTVDPGIGSFIVRELCRALGYAHDATDDEGRRLRIIHRDVSPSNVVISFDGNVKLVDFGIAKALEEAADEQTRTGTLKGKVAYMAPEQLGAAARGIDHRVDLWAAGVVLWETLTAKRMFRGLNEVHTLDLVRSSEIDLPSKFNPRVPPELDRVILKALARAPEARYEHGLAMASDLDDVLAQMRFGAEQLSQLMRFSFEEDSHSRSGRLAAYLDPAQKPEKGLTAPGEETQHLGPPRRTNERGRVRRWAWRFGAAGVLMTAGAFFVRFGPTATNASLIPAVVPEAISPVPRTENDRTEPNSSGSTTSAETQHETTHPSESIARPSEEHIGPAASLAPRGAKPTTSPLVARKSKATPTQPEAGTTRAKPVQPNLKAGAVVDPFE